jgi:hypothetical protein
MTKSTVSAWDSTATNNTDVGGINIAEGCPASNVNNGMREMMAQVATQFGLVNYKGADIASATTVDLSAATGNAVDITGSNAITGLGTVPAGQVFILQFDGAPTLTHNGTSLKLLGEADIIAAAGDIAVVVSEGSGNWRMVSFQRYATDYVSSSVVLGSAVSLATATAANLTSISLTAGDWDVSATFAFLSASAVVGAVAGSFSTTTATLDTSPDRYVQNLFASVNLGSSNHMITPGPARFNLTSTTTIYGVARASFSSGSLSVYGALSARRIR